MAQTHHGLKKGTNTYLLELFSLADVYAALAPTNAGWSLEAAGAAARLGRGSGAGEGTRAAQAGQGTPRATRRDGAGEALGPTVPSPARKTPK